MNIEQSSEGHNLNTLDRLSDAVFQARPMMAEVDRIHGGKKLGYYSGELWRNEHTSVQDPSDLYAEMGRYAAEIYGTSMGRKVHEQLRRTGTVITAHHHGVDSLALTVQSSLNTSLGLHNDESSVVPVLATTRVPLRNITFGGGITMARTYKAQKENEPTRNIPYKVRVFPVRMEDMIVGVTPVFTRDMVRNAVKTFTGLSRDGKISDAEHDAGQTVLSLYESDDVLALPNYKNQASVLNNRLWKYLFHPDVRANAPEMAFMGFETVLQNLIVQDLHNESSLLHQMMFNPDLRASLIENLNGTYGSWYHAEDEGHLISGTMFFWGINGKGREYSLNLKKDINGYVLKGSDGVEGVEIPFNADVESINSLQDAITRGKIIPSLLTNFTCCTFSRGVNPIGGFNQVQYLSNMRKGIADSLSQMHDSTLSSWEDTVRQVPISSFGAGMYSVVSEYEDESVRLAGLLELIAHGGLTASELEQIRSVHLSDALLMALPSIYTTVTTPENRNASLAALTETDICSLALKDKLVRIKL